MPAIELRDVCKSCRFGLAIEHLSFQIEAGETFGLLGHEGAGKTTVLDMMSGFIVPDKGQIDIVGYRLPRDTHRVQPFLGIVPQRAAFYEHLTAWDNLAIYASISGIPRKKKPFHLLNILTLLHLLHLKDTRVSTFSLGMKQRLALGCALLTNPRLLYLDEPTSTVDIQERFVLWDYIRSLRSMNKTCVIATNSFEEACTLCDRIALLSSGKLAAIATPQQLRRHYGDIGIDLELFHPLASFAEIKALSGVRKVFSHDRALTIVAYDSKEVLPQVIALVSQVGEIKTLRVRALRLDEILPGPSSQDR